MWTRYRWLIITLMALVAPVAYWLIAGRLGQPGWVQYLALATVIVLVIGYLVGEIGWNLQGRRRPCTKCGHPVEIRSFRIHAVCPECGADL